MSARVLVVDDDPTIAEVVGDYLRDAGLESRHAADGPSALSLAEAWQPDIVVLDLMLPGIDGLEVCRRLRTAQDGQRPVPVIMLTALGEETERVRGLETGADDYVTKQVDPVAGGEEGDVCLAAAWAVPMWRATACSTFWLVIEPCRCCPVQGLGSGALLDRVRASGPQRPAPCPRNCERSTPSHRGTSSSGACSSRRACRSW